MSAHKTDEQCYCQGYRDIYTISNKPGLKFVRTGNPQGFYVSYKEVKATDGKSPDQKQFVYVWVSGEVVWDLDMTLARWKDLKGAIGESYLLWPQGPYPHLSIDYTQSSNGELTLGDAHYSTRQDDNARLHYIKTLDGWAYEKPTFTTSPATKEAADQAIKEVQAFLKKPK